MYISRITHNRTLYKYKSHYDSSWQHKLAQSGLKNPHTQQNPHFRITAQLQEQAMSGLYWLTKGYRSHWAFDTSYNSAYQVHEEITERICLSVLSNSLTLQLKLKADEWQVIQQWEKKNTFNTSTARICQNTYTIKIYMQKSICRKLIMEFSGLYCASSKGGNKLETQVVNNLFICFLYEDWITSIMISMVWFRCTIRKPVVSSENVWHQGLHNYTHHRCATNLAFP